MPATQKDIGENLARREYRFDLRPSRNRSALRKILDAAIEATEEERTLTFNPPSQIQKQVRQGYKVSYNLAFLSVEEVTSMAAHLCQAPQPESPTLNQGV